MFWRQFGVSADVQDNPVGDDMYHRLIKALMAMGVLAVLIACGGGGGGGGDAANNNGGGETIPPLEDVVWDSATWDNAKWQ